MLRSSPRYWNTYFLWEGDIRDWDALERAIDAEIAEQRQFVAWWAVNVTVRQSPGGKDRASNADQRSMVSVEDATRETHISQQQVSRWRILSLG